MKKLRLKYKVLFWFLSFITPVMTWAWVNTENYLYNLIPLCLVIYGVVDILVGDWD